MADGGAYGTDGLMPRPSFIGALALDERERMQRQALQWAILHSEWGPDDVVIKTFMEAVVGKERLPSWGPPDTSGNILANAARQLSTGGLYDRPPRVSHGDDVSAFLDVVDRAGLWRTGQERSRKAIGMGDCILAVGWSERKRIPTLRFVRPDSVCVRVDPNDPSAAVEFAELGLRKVDGRVQYVWEVYCIDDVDVEGNPEPSLRFYRADKADAEYPYGTEITALSRFGTSENIPEKQRYPWIAADGTGRIPRVRYTTTDHLTYWNDLWVRDAARGTMFAIVLWTYMQHCARDATGSMVIAVDIDPPAGTVTNGGNTERVVSVQMNPGSILFTKSSSASTKQPLVTTIGPGVNLKELRETAMGYEAQQCVRLGVSPSDIQRTGNDPSSGAALAITNQGRREYSRAIIPMFAAADGEALQLLAIACRQWRGMTVPESDYTITYDIAPESPQAQAERRAQQDWDLIHGQKSPVDIYIENHPGADEEVAMRELIRVGQQLAEIDRRIAAHNSPTIPATQPSQVAADAA